MSFKNYGMPEGQGLSQNMEPAATTALAERIAARLNEDIPTAQIARGLKRYEANIQPNLVTMKVVGAVISTNYTVVQTFDNTYSFFGTKWACKFTTTQDADYLVNSLQIANETNLLTNSMPVSFLTQWTVNPLDFYLYVPANANLSLNVTTGATTAVTTAYFTFFGYRVPTFVIDSIKKKQR
ncbi:MAG: hypothetical protein EHM58_04525 [Ignavibacteriae bacterium]|nr:MAG: hypothetical protein EHM58_04525 [Ignavibacteriota bacterium]